MHKAAMLRSFKCCRSSAVIFVYPMLLRVNLQSRAQLAASNTLANGVLPTKTKEHCDSQKFPDAPEVSIVNTLAASCEYAEQKQAQANQEQGRN